jgi:hypothetical protein
LGLLIEDFGPGLKILGLAGTEKAQSAPLACGFLPGQRDKNAFQSARRSAPKANSAWRFPRSSVTQSFPQITVRFLHRASSAKLFSFSFSHRSIGRLT